MGSGLHVKTKPAAATGFMEIQEYSLLPVKNICERQAFTGLLNTKVAPMTLA